MSCGFPLPNIKVPAPKIPSPKLPKLPKIPDFGWAADLGISIDVKLPKLPTPKIPSPKLPKLPKLPEIPCPFDEADEKKAA